MATPEQKADLMMAQLVSRYCTPIAIILVALGILLTSPVYPTREIVIGLLIVSALFNSISVQWIKQKPAERHVRLKARVVINVMMNVLLVYFLGAYWTPVWILLLLTPVATGMYGTRTRTLQASVVATIILLGIHATRGQNSPLYWGEQICYGVVIILLSLMVNDLARAAKSH